jgi:hypothetical protein
LRGKLRNTINERSYKLFLRAFTAMRGTQGIDYPALRLTMRDKGTDAYYRRVVDVAVSKLSLDLHPMP